MKWVCSGVPETEINDMYERVRRVKPFKPVFYAELYCKVMSLESELIPTSDVKCVARFLSKCIAVNLCLESVLLDERKGYMLPYIKEISVQLMHACVMIEKCTDNQIQFKDV